MLMALTVAQMLASMSPSPASPNLSSTFNSCVHTQKPSSVSSSLRRCSQYSSRPAASIEPQPVCCVRICVRHLISLRPISTSMNVQGLVNMVKPCSWTRRVLLVGLVLAMEAGETLAQQELHRRQPHGPRRRYAGPNAIEIGRENKRAWYLSVFSGSAFGLWLSGWSLRSKNRKTAQKYEKELKALEKRYEQEYSSRYLSYQQRLEKKQDDYLEKYKHLMYIQNALQEAGIELDLKDEVHSYANDYDEFKLPDTNNDGKISRKEFDTYMTKYLKENPQYSQYDYPTFEEFDRDRDGLVTFSEWQDYIYAQEQAAKEQEALYQREQASAKRKR